MTWLIVSALHCINRLEIMSNAIFSNIKEASWQIRKKPKNSKSRKVHSAAWESPFPRRWCWIFPTIHTPTHPTVWRSRWTAIARNSVEKGKPYSCEWLLRPKVALSELSGTVTKNMKIMTNKDQKVFVPETVKKFVSEMSDLNKPLKKLHKDDVTSASQKDVLDVLKFLFQDHEDLDSIVDKMFHVGGAMFATAVQLIVARTLVQDPERYAELVEASETGSDAVFKKNSDIESMRDFIVSSVLGRQHQRSKQPAQRSPQAV